jgi:predicted cobalt transporter CbtA
MALFALLLLAGCVLTATGYHLIKVSKEDLTKRGRLTLAFGFFLGFAGVLAFVLLTVICLIVLADPNFFDFTDD